VFGLPEGGETLIVVNQELRLPIYKWLRGVGFVDAGNIYAKDQPVVWRDLKFGYGFGLRIDTPVGLGRIDFGIPASTVIGEVRATNSVRAGRVYFGIGHIF
jgi:outer membrane protein insertion porin family